MLRFRVRHGVLCQLYCTLVILKNFHSKHVHVFGLRGGMASVTHFLRPTKPHLTDAPPHITTPQDTDLRSGCLTGIVRIGIVRIG